MKADDRHKRASLILLLLVAATATAQTIWQDTHPKPSCSRCIAGALRDCYGPAK